MFQKAELNRLQQRKELLVVQSNAHRLLLRADWQRVRSPENWVGEAGRLARRHPVWVAVLSAVAGVAAVQAVRKPGSVTGGFEKLGRWASLAVSVWKMMRRQPKD